MSAPASPAPAPSNGYVRLIRENANFRRLWGGNVVSLFGDWFNTIAIYELVKELTGSELALGLVFLTKMLPMALVAPIAGVVVDRLNRRHVMIASDVVRGVLVLGFLLVDEASDLWLIYTLTALQIGVSAFFFPAKSASLPNIVSKEDLLAANALMSATWSTMLALGAAAGGAAVEYLGIEMVFVFDALTYAVSAWFIWRTRIPQDTEAAERGVNPVVAGLRKIGEGWRYLRERPPVGRMALAKAAWSIGGGAPVFMLVLLGDLVLPQSPAIGYSILLTARGLGTGVGPIAARSLFRDEARWPAVLGGCIVVSGAFYLGVGLVPWTGLWLVAGLVFLAHAASGANWVLSTTLLQQRSEDRFRGRVFSTDWLLTTLAQSASILAASLLLDADVLDLRTAILVSGAVSIATGFVWLAVIVPRERQAAQETAPV